MSDGDSDGDNQIRFVVEKLNEINDTLDKLYALFESWGKVYVPKDPTRPPIRRLGVEAIVFDPKSP